MNRLRSDFQLAVRSLARAPGYALAAVLTLAIGIGATTSVFSVAYGILLRPLPIRDPSRVVVLWGHNPTLQPEHFPIWGEEYKALTREFHGLSQTAAFVYFGAIQQPMTLADSAVTIGNAEVTGGFFDVLGVRPRLGRLLHADDDVPGGTPVLVISEAFWRRAFGGDTAAIGRHVTLLRKEYTIVGVAPGGLDFPRGADVWTPLRAVLPASNGDTLRAFLDVIGRLSAGASTQQVQAELGAFFQRPNEPHSGARQMIGNTLRPVTRPVSEVIVGDVRPAMRVVVGAVVLLLLVTCINIANLMLVRAVGRRREFAVRAALGGSRARIAQQLLMESGAVALAGAAVGVVLAHTAISLFLAAAPAGLPRLDQVGTNGPVLACAVVLAIGVAFAVGLLPALMAGRLSLAIHLREGQGGDGGSGTHRMRSALVGAQVAVTVAVLIGAGVVVRSFERLMHLDLGFDNSHVLIAQMAPTSRAPTADPSKDPQVLAAQRLDLFDQVRARVRALPGVRGATMLLRPPFQPNGLDIAYSLPGEPIEAAAGRPMIDGLGADDAFFQTLGIPIERGRGFTVDDRENAARVAVVDASLARTIWGKGDPIGKQIGIGTLFYSVVGIAGETRFRDLRSQRQSIYVPYRQSPGWGPSFLAVRTTGDPAAMAAVVRRAVAADDSPFFISGITTITQEVDAGTAQSRLDAVLLAGFGISILLLTALGLYNIAATYVRQREFEIAVRVAMGAEPRRVVQLVLRQGVGVVLIGVAAGVCVALAGAGVLGSIVYDVRERDPMMFAIAIVSVTAVAVIAFLVPARRAARANPAQVLRAG